MRCSFFLVKIFLIITLTCSFLDAQLISNSKSNYERNLTKEGIADSSLKYYTGQNLPYTEKELQLLKERYLKEKKRGISLSSKDTTDTSIILDSIQKMVRDTAIKKDSLTLLKDSLRILKEKEEAKKKERAKYFGYSLFDNIPEAFKPNSYAPTDPGYVVGTGDVIRISVWGEVEFQYELEVSREGKIFIPTIGVVYVSGMSVDELQKKLKLTLSRHYSGLTSEPPKTFLDISIARMRPIRVFVMGELETPGGYTISSSSTAFNALYSTGGPLISGTLRSIKVLRKQKEIAEVDVYQYLLAGKCSTDVRLQNDDVIFIPRRGKTVAVKGSVFRPSIYELKENENLRDLLKFCGGILPATNTKHALIHRVKPFEQRVQGTPDYIVITINLEEYLKGDKDFPLFDNDTLNIIPLSYELRNYVLLKGAVHYPGLYECDSTLTLYKLIYELGKPIEEMAFEKRADILRLNEDRITYTTIPIDLQELKENPSSYAEILKPFDEVIVYEKSVEKPIDLFVSIEGEVKRPGMYLLTNNMSVIDVILRAGGFTRGAYTKSVDVYRIRENESGDTITEIFKIDLPDKLDFSKPTPIDFKLQDRDKIFVRSNPNYQPESYVVLDGYVKFKGKYALRKRDERLSDIIERAGGVLPDGFLEGAVVIRKNRRVVVDFKKALADVKSNENILLQKDDSIYIPKRPNTVLVTGNVNNPGYFSYVPKQRLKTYLEKAGGVGDSSDFILVKTPIGDSWKISRFSMKNPVIEEGSEIIVTKKKPKEKSGEEKRGPTIAEVIRDTLAIMASALTVIGLMVQLRKG